MLPYPESSMGLTRDIIVQKALELGFLECGFAPLEPLTQMGYLREWLSKGMHGEMQYMEKYTDLRQNPSLLLEGARTMVVLTVNYNSGEYSRTAGKYRLSQYALGDDYHDVIRSKLAQLLETIRGIDPGVNGRYFVDSGPVMEKAWAQKAGIGWIGKNGLLITRQAGSWVFLAVMLLNREFAYDQPSAPHCGTCTRCMHACPTGAIVSPGQVDARRCISYLTIEKKGPFDDAVPKWENWIFGCDACQEVCPWNKKVKITPLQEFLPRKEILRMASEDWENLTSEKYSELFRKSAVKRAKVEGLMRNILWVKGE